MTAKMICENAKGCDDLCKHYTPHNFREECLYSVCNGTNLECKCVPVEETIKSENKE